MRSVAFAILIGVGCSEPTPRPVAKQVGSAEPTPGASEPANACDDAPAIAKTEIVFCKGGLSVPHGIIAGEPLVVVLPNCCVLAITGGEVRRLVTREILGGVTVAQGWVYIAAQGQTGRTPAIERVALDGGGREPVLSLTATDAPIAVAVAGSHVYAVSQRVDPNTMRTTEVRLHRAPLGGGAATSDVLAVPFVALASRGDRVVLASDRQVFEVRGLDLAPIARSSDTIAAIATHGDEVYVATHGQVGRVTRAGSIEMLGRGDFIDTIAASATHVAWNDRHDIVVAAIAGGEARRVATFRELPTSLAVDANAVYWSVPYYYAPGATTTEERRESQRAGFVARTAIR